MHRGLTTILLSLTLASVGAGCATFSSAVARVDDDELSSADLEDRLEERAAVLAERGEVPDRPGSAETAREVISEWIVETAGGVSDADVAARFGEGIQVSGISCPAVISTVDLATAEEAVERLSSGDDFDSVFSDLNVNPNLDVSAGRVGCFTVDQISPQDLESPDVQALFEVTAAQPARAVEVGDATFTEGFVVVHRGLDEIEGDEGAAVADFVRSEMIADLDLSGFDIHVDSRYGTFNPETGSITVLG
ncbi:MAG: hypothetical protein AB8G26_05055 [Ilumatobacter sp.]